MSQTSRTTISYVSHNPSGQRKRDLDLLETLSAAAAFQGLPDGIQPSDICNLVRRAGRDHGWSPALVQHYQQLVEWTEPWDWLPGSRPVVWVPVEEMAEYFDLSESQVRRRERQLFELGALTWADSPNHRRYGLRDGDGRIIEAYGVDLSPVVQLLPQLQAQASGRILREDPEYPHVLAARRRLTAAAYVFRSAVDCALMDGILTSDDGESWLEQLEEISGAALSSTSPDAIEDCIGDIEKLRQAFLHHCRPDRSDGESIDEESGQRASEDGAHLRCGGKHEGQGHSIYTKTLYKCTCTSTGTVALRAVSHQEKHCGEVADGPSPQVSIAPTAPDLGSAGARLLALAEERIGAGAARWFVGCSVAAIADGRLDLTVPTPFVERWIAHNYSELLVELCAEIGLPVTGVRLVVGAAAIRTEAPAREPQETGGEERELPDGKAGDPDPLASAILGLLPDGGGRTAEGAPGRSADIPSRCRVIAGRLQISGWLWNSAVQSLGIRDAAGALAITFRKTADGRVHSPGGYFRSLVRRGQDGTLNLGPSVFSLIHGGGGVEEAVVH